VRLGVRTADGVQDDDIAGRHRVVPLHPTHRVEAGEQQASVDFLEDVDPAVAPTEDRRWMTGADYVQATDPGVEHAVDERSVALVDAASGQEFLEQPDGGPQGLLNAQARPAKRDPRIVTANSTSNINGAGTIGRGSG
jgi:hypothetical protein